MNLSKNHRKALLLELHDALKSERAAMDHLNDRKLKDNILNDNEAGLVYATAEMQDYLAKERIKTISNFLIENEIDY